MSENKSKSLFIIVYLSLMIFLLSMSSCGSSKEMKKCCEKTANEVYKYEE